MTTASSSGQSSFGLSRRKKAPGLMDQISTFFGGDKKKGSKGSFRGHATSPKPVPRRRANENAVMHFFRSLSPQATSSPHPKSRWRKVLGLVGHSNSVLNPPNTADFTALPRHCVLMPQSHLTDAAETKEHCPKSSTWRPSPALLPNAGAPSSELSLDDKINDPTEREKDEEEK
uniref:Myelin basic protein n=1 Tax=Oncorhynchus kisutch TaxID=8019 RepID=A0A8C7J1Q4_ONCKI